MTTDTNAFEAARAARIEENKRRMAEMGIASLAADIMMRTPTPTKKRVQVRFIFSRQFYDRDFHIALMMIRHARCDVGRTNAWNTSWVWILTDYR